MALSQAVWFKMSTDNILNIILFFGGGGGWGGGGTCVSHSYEMSPWCKICPKGQSLFSAKEKQNKCNQLVSTEAEGDVLGPVKLD